MNLILDEKNTYVVRNNTSPPTMNQIFQLQKFMEDTLSEEEKCDPDSWVKHTFSSGVYAREITMPKGILIIGKIHRHPHINIISRGKATVYTTEGSLLLDATNKPVTFESKPFTKRVVYNHTETVWTTIHLTNERDIAKIEQDIIVTPEEYQQLVLDKTSILYIKEK
jgi:hypothetical protein